MRIYHAQYNSKYIININVKNLKIYIEEGKIRRYSEERV